MSGIQEHIIILAWHASTLAQHGVASICEKEKSDQCCRALRCIVFSYDFDEVKLDGAETKNSKERDRK